MADQPIGPILDGLGVTIDLDDGDLIESALVLAKHVDADGLVSLSLASSDGMSWLEQLGLLAAAQQIVNSQHWDHPDD